MHFVYGNSLASVEEYRRRFPDRRIPSRHVFTRIHKALRDNAFFFPGVSVSSERQGVGTINTRENILATVERNPRLSTSRMASRIGGVSHMLVLRALHEEDFYPYHDQLWDKCTTIT
jgi:hypothetical protein